MLERIKKFIWNGSIDLAEINVFAVAFSAFIMLFDSTPSWEEFGLIILAFNAVLFGLYVAMKFGLMPIVNFLEKYKK